MADYCADDIFLHRVPLALTGGRKHDRLVFALKRAMQEEDSYETTLWGLTLGEGARPSQLSSPAFAASSPAFDPDGARLAFLSRRGDDGRQVHLLPMEGGEARKLTHAKEATLSSIEEWSDDGRSLLVTASVKWTEDGERERKVGRPPQVARYLPYKKDGTGITVGERTHLYSVDAESGELTALTSGDFDVSIASWSPDGKRLAFVRKRSGRERHRTDLWIAQADGREARRLVDSLASISRIAWSPDGRALALSGSRIEGDSTVGLWLVEPAGGALQQPAGGELELEPASTLQWHPDGTRLALIADSRGVQQIVTVRIRDGEVRRLQRGLGSVQGLAQCGPRLAFIGSSMRRLEEIYSIDWDGQDERRHSDLNCGWFRQRPRPRVSKRRFPVPDGTGGTEKVDAWLLRPDGEGPFPLLVDFHGGPHSVALADFSAHTYWYLLLSRGWAIVAPNTVGSSGYGQAFSRRLCGHWGEFDLPQVEAIVRTLQDEGLADERVGCAGKSYGGFLSAWAVGHSKLFKAAAVAAPVANIRSHGGTSDTGYYVTPFAMGADLHEGVELYHRLSPISYCTGVEAATLILQGENDGRCPRGQSEELFAHLIHCSKAPVELVVYPESTHSEAESGKPSNRIDYHRRLADWMERHVHAGTERHASDRTRRNEERSSSATRVSEPAA